MDKYLNDQVQAWDQVMLNNHTGRYRAYSVPTARGFIFACLDADVIRVSWDSKVTSIVRDGVLIGDIQKQRSTLSDA